MVRSFLAIDLSHEVREVLASHLRREWRRLPCRIKWVAPENLHVTLKFLAEVPEHGINLIRQALSARLEAAPPMDLTLSGPGAFPVAAKARVLWVGLKESRELLDLHSAIDTALEPLGFERERKPFHPHITVGRIRERFSVYKKIHPFFETQIEPLSFHVPDVVLYRSDLTPDGPIYSPICRFALNGPHPGPGP